MGQCCSSGTPDSNFPKHTGSPRKAAAQSHKAELPTFGLPSEFTVLKLLGTGGEGETWLVLDDKSKEQVAIKFVKRPIPRSITQIIQREIKILADLGDGHLNIVHANEVILTKTHLGLIMEYVAGGNMVSYVTKHRETRYERNGLVLSEDECRYFFRQLIWAVEFCHKNHVAHRDLKLDNTILDDHDPPYLKLCDFGFAKSWNVAPHMDTMRIGTPEYMGPELISGRTGYDGKKVDVWASGVLLFVMLLGTFPFEMEDENYVNTQGLYSIWMQQIRTSWRENTQTSSVMSQLSPECVDLLDKMFDVKQESRISIEGIMEHPWFNKPLPSKYAHALEELREQQRLIDRRAVDGQWRSSERDKALQVLLDKATQPPLPQDDVIRVNLTQLRKAYTFVDRQNGNMASVVEEEVEPELK